MARVGGSKDSLAAYKIIVSVENMRMGFLELSGLPVDAPAADRTANAFRAIPGLRKYSNISLKRGYALDRAGLWTWWQSVMDGNTQSKRGTITLMGEAGKPIAVWEFSGAWPAKLVGPALNAKGNEVAIEEMELGVEGLTLTP
jgi:phage tail-like protein